MSAATTATAVLDTERPAGTEGCADAASLQRAVTSRLHRRIFDVGDSVDLHVTLVYSRSDDGVWHARLSVRTRSGSPRGERELATSAAHCSALDDSLALVMALMLDVSREEIAAAETGETPVEPSPPGNTPASRPARVTSSPTDIRLPRTTVSPREPWRVAVGAFAQGALGNLPDPAIGAGIELVLQPPSPLLLVLEFGAWLPQTLTAPEGATAHLRSGAAALFLCRRWGGTASFDLCLGQRVGLTDARGQGFDRDERVQAVSYGLGMRGQFAIRWRTAEFGVAPELDVPTSRGQFYYAKSDGSSGTLYRAAPVVVAAAVGLTIDL